MTATLQHERRIQDHARPGVRTDLGDKGGKILEGSDQGVYEEWQEKGRLGRLSVERGYFCLPSYSCTDPIDETRFVGVLDSVKQGKRLSESAYNVIENEASLVVYSGS
jgi:hypothetical protein